MAWSQDERNRFLNGLDAAQRVLILINRCLMALIMAGVIVVSVCVYLWRPLGAGNQGEYFYFGVVALLIFGWAASQLFQPTRRKSRSGRPNVSVETKEIEGGRTWQ